MISYLLPTHDRPGALGRTLSRLGFLPAAAHEGVGGAEVIIVDNASAPPAWAPRRLGNGLPVRLIRLDGNRMAAARNVGALAARGEWLCMLDDDSHPLDAGHVDVLHDAPGDVAAIGGEILLPDGRHEAGGLPEVFVGCGALVRRDAYLSVGGYDAAFGFYAEEYDLCAKLIRAGWRIGHDFRMRVRHERTGDGRDTDRTLQHLVRNSSWVIERYAPCSRSSRTGLIEAVVERCRIIASKEGAMTGFRRGLVEMDATRASQPRWPMTGEQWDRFTGRSAARRRLARCAGQAAAIMEPGKHVEIVRQVLDEIGAEVVDAIPAARADVVVIGTLSPGPVTDGAARWRGRGRPVIAPWECPPRISASIPCAAARQTASPTKPPD